MAKYFFDATEGAHEQLTLLYDFVWPTGVAMWNLRWQVAGFMLAQPEATDQILSGRFAEGSQIRGANLRRACVEHSWDDQKEHFARVLLFNCFAIFEGWVVSTLAELGSHTKANEKGLQFPTGTLKKPGVHDVIASLTSTESAVMKGCFYDQLKKSKKYNHAHLTKLLLCYRYFKEIRNALMHAGGVATQRTVDAYTGYSSITNAADLGMSELPAHNPVVLGSRPMLNLRGVVGLSEVMLRIVTTLDAELCRAAKSEAAFERRWKQQHPKRLDGLPLNQHKRALRIEKFAQKAGFPKPERPAKLADFLKSKNLAWF